MTVCYLGLGSNLRSPVRQLRQAIAKLQKLPASTIVSISTIYISKPCGVRAQPNYCNLVVAMHTSLPILRLLHHCQTIENSHRRLRKKRWGARTLDIDLLLYGSQILNTPNLVIPHPHMLERDFVLVPLLEISPNIQLPNGQLLATYLPACKKYVSDAI